MVLSKPGLPLYLRFAHLRSHPPPEVRLGCWDIGEGGAADCLTAILLLLRVVPADAKRRGRRLARSYEIAPPSVWGPNESVRRGGPRRWDIAIGCERVIDGDDVVCFDLMGLYFFGELEIGSDNPGEVDGLMDGWERRDGEFERREGDVLERHLS